MLWLELNNARDASQREGRAPGWDFSPSLPSLLPAVPHAAVRILSCGCSEVSWRERSSCCCFVFPEAASSDPEARCGLAGEPVLCPGGAGVCRAAGISVLNAAADGWEAWKAA